MLYGGYGPYGDLNDTWVFETPPSASLAAAPTTSEVSAPVTFTASVSGGTPLYRATFDFGDNMSAVATSADGTLTVTHVYDGAGTFQPAVNVTDFVGAAATATASPVTVVEGPRVIATADSLATDIGVPLSFSSHLTVPGIPPVNYTWHFGDGASAFGANASHAYSTTGSFTVSVTAVDSLGGVSTATLSVSVHPLPSISLAATPSSPVAGSPVVFYANVTGGTAPYQYSWRFGDGASSSYAAPTHAFPGAGRYTLEVWVKDSVGASSHQTETYVVSTSSANSAGAAGAPDWFWAALIAVGAVGAFVLLRRCRAPPKP